MQTTGPVKLGTVGFGIMGERLMRVALDHDPAVLEVSGAWDPDRAACERLAASLPGVTVHPTLEALLAASDCVHVASPPGYHLAQLEAAVDAGLAVLCEKPLATDVAAARDVVARMEARGARAGVNFPFTSSFAVDQLDAWRGEGAVGDVEAVEIEVDFAAWPRPWQEAAASWLTKRAEGGFTREVITHFLFLTSRQLGPVTLRNSSVEYPGGDECEVAMTAELEAGGVPVSLKGRIGGTDKPDHNLWVLVGKKGCIRLRDWAVAERLGADGQWAESPDARPNEEVRPLVLKRQLNKVVAMTRGEPHTLATLREALAMQELVETILDG